MAISVPRFLLPNGPHLPRNQLQYLRRNLLQAQRNPQPCRNVTSSPTGKPDAAPTPPVLEKPDQFRPPSHGRRLKAQAPRNYGPELTQQQRIQQSTKKYPNMFPPKGSFMFWFLTDADLHMFITLGTLFTLAGIAFFENAFRDTAFKDTLPSKEEWLANPLQAWKDFIWLWKLSTWENSLEADSIRRNNVNDVQKRNTWRKYHGIEDKQGLGPWRPTEEVLTAWEEKKREKGEVTPKRPSRAFLGISWGD